MATTYTTQSSIIAVGTGKIWTAPKSTTPLSATWTETFQTLKDSLKIDQAAGTAIEVFIDQSELPVYSVTKAGKVTLTFQIPNTATAMLNTFFNTVVETATTSTPLSITGTSGAAPYEGVGLKMSLKNPDIMFRVELAEGNQMWVFYNLTISRRLVAGTLSTSPVVIEVTADITANPDPTKSDVIILNKVNTVVGA